MYRFSIKRDTLTDKLCDGGRRLGTRKDHGMGSGSVVISVLQGDPNKANFSQKPHACEGTWPTLLSSQHLPFLPIPGEIFSKF